MASEEAKRAATIKEETEELQELLRILLLNINNLVERNPKDEAATPVEPRPDNVFDEILREIAVCKGLILEATEKVDMGISYKVH